MSRTALDRAPHARVVPTGGAGRRAMPQPTPLRPLDPAAAPLPTHRPDPGERALTGRTRLLIAAYAAATPRPALGPALSMWLQDRAARVLADWPTREPAQHVGLDMTGLANVFAHRFLPPTGSVFAAPHVRTAVRTELTAGQRAATARLFGDRDPRLAWWTPAGLVLDEIRVGPHWDDPLDGWMRPKLHADLTVGAALAHSRGERFLGVRLLTLGYPRGALVVTAGDSGALVTAPLDTLRLAEWPTGVTPLTATLGAAVTAAELLTDPTAAPASEQSAPAEVSA